MSRIKIFLTVMLFSAPVLFSLPSYAFTLPKEFGYLNTTFSPDELTEIKEESIPINNNAHSENIKAALLLEYAHWKGTLYHMGGTTHRGVDCSALMQHLFKDSLNKQLPRTTFQQIKNGKKISKTQLKPGDLVFFKTSRSDRHVGVYVGNNQFIHASKIRGVTISSLNNQYWINHYETARRIELIS